MKSLFRLIAVVFFFLFLGWVYVVYLYLHDENKATLKNIKVDLDKSARKIVKEVNIQKSELVKVAENYGEEFSDVLLNRQDEIKRFVRDMRQEVFELRDIAERFKYVSERTLRRDLQKMEKLGVLKKSGSTKDAKYSIIG